MYLSHRGVVLDPEAPLGSVGIGAGDELHFGSRLRGCAHDRLTPEYREAALLLLHTLCLPVAEGSIRAAAAVLGKQFEPAAYPSSAAAALAFGAATEGVAGVAAAVEQRHSRRDVKPVAAVPRSSIDDMLRDRNLYRVERGGGGDCLFHVLAFELAGRGSIPAVLPGCDARSLRIDLVGWLREHRMADMGGGWRLHHRIEAEAVARGFGGFDDYLRQMAKPGTYADGGILLATAWKHQLRIGVVSSNGFPDFTIGPPGWENNCKANGLPDFRVLHLPEVHYQGLLNVHDVSRQPLGALSGSAVQRLPASSSTPLQQRTPSAPSTPAVSSKGASVSKDSCARMPVFTLAQTDSYKQQLGAAAKDALDKLQAFQRKGGGFELWNLPSKFPLRAGHESHEAMVGAALGLAQGVFATVQEAVCGMGLYDAGRPGAQQNGAKIMGHVRKIREIWDACCDHAAGRSPPAQEPPSKVARHSHVPERRYLLHACGRIAELRSMLRSHAALRVTYSSNIQCENWDLVFGQEDGRGAKKRFRAGLESLLNELAAQFPGRVESGRVSKERASAIDIMVWGADRTNWTGEPGSRIDGYRQARVMGRHLPGVFGIVTTPLRDDDSKWEPHDLEPSVLPNCLAAAAGGSTSAALVAGPSAPPPAARHTPAVVPQPRPRMLSKAEDDHGFELLKRLQHTFPEDTWLRQRASHSKRAVFAAQMHLDDPKRFPTAAHAAATISRAGPKLAAGFVPLLARMYRQAAEGEAPPPSFEQLQAQGLCCRDLEFHLEVGYLLDAAPPGAVPHWDGLGLRRAPPIPPPSTLPPSPRRPCSPSPASPSNACSPSSACLSPSSPTSACFSPDPPSQHLPAADGCSPDDLGAHPEHVASADAVLSQLSFVSAGCSTRQPNEQPRVYFDGEAFYARDSVVQPLTTASMRCLLKQMVPLTGLLLRYLELFKDEVYSSELEESFWSAYSKASLRFKFGKRNHPQDAFFDPVFHPKAVCAGDEMEDDMEVDTGGGGIDEEAAGAAPRQPSPTGRDRRLDARRAVLLKQRLIRYRLKTTIQDRSLPSIAAAAALIAGEFDDDERAAVAAYEGASLQAVRGWRKSLCELQELSPEAEAAPAVLPLLQDELDEFHRGVRQQEAALAFEDGELLHGIDTCHVCGETRPVFHATPPLEATARDAEVRRAGLQPAPVELGAWGCSPDIEAVGESDADGVPLGVCKRCAASRTQRRKVARETATPPIASPFSGICTTTDADLGPATDELRHNNMHFLPKPHFLEGLTPVERALIARISSVQRVHLLRQGMLSSKGHCVSVPNELAIATQLPRLGSQAPCACTHA